jgi:hypothetical protein
MSRIQLPLIINDVSALSRSLRKQLQCTENVPSHVEMLNLLAKSAGYKNFQHLKAELAPAHEPEPEINRKRLNKAAGYFDLNGSLSRWPKKYSMRVLCLWGLWSRLPARIAMTELELDEKLILNHSFCDHTMLRRWLVDEKLVSRTPDGREYRRIESRPPFEALELIKRVNK